jgi:hypothetical protein
LLARDRKHDVGEIREILVREHEPPQRIPARESKPAEIITNCGLKRTAAGTSTSRNARRISSRPEPAGNGLLSESVITTAESSLTSLLSVPPDQSPRCGV